MRRARHTIKEESSDSDEIRARERSFIRSRLRKQQHGAAHASNRSPVSSKAGGRAANSATHDPDSDDEIRAFVQRRRRNMNSNAIAKGSTGARTSEVRRSPSPFSDHSAGQDGALTRGELEKQIVGDSLRRSKVRETNHQRQTASVSSFRPSRSAVQSIPSSSVQLSAAPRGKSSTASLLRPSSKKVSKSAMKPTATIEVTHAPRPASSSSSRSSTQQVQERHSAAVVQNQPSVDVKDEEPVQAGPSRTQKSELDSIHELVQSIVDWHPDEDDRSRYEVKKPTPPVRQRPHTASYHKPQQSHRSNSTATAVVRRPSTADRVPHRHPPRVGTVQQAVCTSHGGACRHSPIIVRSAPFIRTAVNRINVTRGILAEEDARAEMLRHEIEREAEDFGSHGLETLKQLESAMQNQRDWVNAREEATLHRQALSKELDILRVLGTRQAELQSLMERLNYAKQTG